MMSPLVGCSLPLSRSPRLPRRDLLLALVLVVEGVAARDVVSFDFGWRHRTGVHQPAKPDAPAPHSPYVYADAAEAAVGCKRGYKSLNPRLVPIRIGECSDGELSLLFT